jgi:hypothetical protein
MNGRAGQAWKTWLEDVELTGIDIFGCFAFPEKYSPQNAERIVRCFWKEEISKFFSKDIKVLQVADRQPALDRIHYHFVGKDLTEKNRSDKSKQDLARIVSWKWKTGEKSLLRGTCRIDAYDETQGGIPYMFNRHEEWEELIFTRNDRK